MKLEKFCFRGLVLWVSFNWYLVYVDSLTQNLLISLLVTEIDEIELTADDKGQSLTEDKNFKIKASHSIY